jgi:hypothetical protein
MKKGLLIWRRGESEGFRGLKARKLLILHLAQSAKKAKVASPGYTAGTRAAKGRRICQRGS